MLGGVGTASASVNSTAPGGFYKGAFDGFTAPYAGLFADVRIARFGSSSQPFGTWVLSIGPVVDVMHARLSYNGTGGGVPVSDSGRLTQLDYLGVLKLTTPLSPASNLSIFAGGGGATLWPTGTPTGPGGPAITGSNTTPVFRAGAEISRQMGGGFSVALQLAYQRTTSVSFDTTRPDERFRFGDSDSFMLGLTLNFNDLLQTPPPPPPPRRPGFIGQEGGGAGGTKVTTDSGLEAPTLPAKKGRTSLGSCIKGGNCGSFIWRPDGGGVVSDTDRIAIFKKFYKKPTKVKLCDVVFYNNGDDTANTHVEFVSKVDANGNILETIGQDADKAPITIGPWHRNEMTRGAKTGLSVLQQKANYMVQLRCTVQLAPAARSSAHNFSAPARVSAPTWTRAQPMLPRASPWCKTRGSRPPRMGAYFSCRRRYAASAVASDELPTNCTPQRSSGFISRAGARATRPAIC
jgi:hypothetical protein